MVQFLFVFIITVLIQFIPVKTDKEYKIRTFISFVPLFLYGIIRVECPDYDAYLKLYTGVHGTSMIEDVNKRMELGWVYFNLYMPSFQMVIVITSLLYCFSCGFIFYKLVPIRYSWLAFLLYFLSCDKTFYFSLTGMRNGIVISVFLLLYNYISKRKWFKYMVVSLIAATFHTSALLFLPISYLIGRVKMNRKAMIIYMVIAVFFLVAPIERLTSEIQPFIAAMTSNFDSYMEKDARQSASLAVFGSFSLFVMMLLLIKSEKKFSLDNALINLALIYPLSFMMGSLNVRTTQFYIIFFIIFVTQMMESSKNHLVKQWFLVLTLLFMGYTFVNEIIVEGSLPYLYKTILS